MKLSPPALVFQPILSLPARGAWIEMSGVGVMAHEGTSLPARGAWIEIKRTPEENGIKLSLPARGAWIEIGRVSC